MGAYLGEIILTIAIFYAVYLLFRPLQKRLERHLRSWLDRNRGPSRARPIINVYPIKSDEDKKK
jgi:hypothetical protein